MIRANKDQKPPPTYTFTCMSGSKIKDNLAAYKAQSDYNKEGCGDNRFKKDSNEWWAYERKMNELYTKELTGRTNRLEGNNGING